MRTLWNAIGRSLFWLSWPVLWLYLRGSNRTRVMIIKDNTLLVTKGWMSDGRWSLPGGGLHRREAVISGARREVFEETGLEVSADALTIVGAYKGSNRGLRFRYTLLRADVSRLPLQNVRPQLIEISAVRWLSPQQLALEDCQPEVRQALAIWSV